MPKSNNNNNTEQTEHRKRRTRDVATEDPIARTVVPKDVLEGGNGYIFKVHDEMSIERLVALKTDSYFVAYTTQYHHLTEMDLWRLTII